MNESFLYQTNEVLIQVVFFALMMAATEAGYRLGRKVRSRHAGEYQIANLYGRSLHPRGSCSSAGIHYLDGRDPL